MSMALGDIFKTKQFKSDIEKLQSDIAFLNNLLTPEMKDAIALKNLIDDLHAESHRIAENLENGRKMVSCEEVKLQSLQDEIEKKKKYIIFLDDETLFQNFGLYTPMYNLVNSEAYKDKLDIVRQKQKNLIKSEHAVTFPSNFTFNNSLTQGKKLIADNVKHVIRAFNNECEAIIDKVKFNNVESVRKRIIKSYEDLNKLNSKMQINITSAYLDLKLQEMNLCYEYSLKKQEEKEESKRIREEQREEQKLQREIEESRKTSEKERTHYSRALSNINSQLENCSESDRIILVERMTEIERHIQRIDEELRQIDYREANQRAGYVYIISNIGAFGENVYKIGMTRRLDPMDRIDELGDASVPFRFDVHALIFSDDAPALESSLHRAFDSKKVNMVNTRREFFSVTLEEIEQVVKANYDKTVEFTKIPTADQYRESQMIRNQNSIPQLVHSQPIIETTAPPSTPPSVDSTIEDTNVNYIYTKWGRYPEPNPYKVNFVKNFPK